MLNNEFSTRPTATPWSAGGTWMRSLRVRAEITATELAEQISAPSLAWVLDVEAGLRPVPSSMYKVYAKHLGIAVGGFAMECLRHYDRKAHEALMGTVEESLQIAA